MYHAELGSFHLMAETNVLNVDQKNHMTPKAVMTHVAVVIVTESIFYFKIQFFNHSKLTYDSSST